MLVGNNIVLVVYGILIAKLFDSTIFSALDDGMRVTADTIVSTLIILLRVSFFLRFFLRTMPTDYWLFSLFLHTFSMLYCGR